MPITAITFLIGCLAISGIPPFGFGRKMKLEVIANPVFCCGLFNCWNYGFLYVPDASAHFSGKSAERNRNPRLTKVSS